jgi:hypothetical protein
MTSEEDAKYLARRETEERVIADATSDPMVKGIHEVLAERYADRGLALEGTVGQHGAGAAQASPLVVAAADGGVTIAASSGKITFLTPLAAEQASDSLLAKPRDADRDEVRADIEDEER